MKITDVLHRDAVCVDLKARDKKGVLEEMVKPLAVSANLEKKTLLRILMDREQLGSTGIGGGIGIPHGKLKGLDTLILGFGSSQNGIDFESIDGRPAHLFFMLITPEDSTGLHLKLLARISRILKNEPFKERLFHAADTDEVFNIISQEDEDF